MTAWDFNEFTSLTESLAGVSGRVTPAVTKAISDGGEKIRDLAKELAPKASGDMADSIESTLLRSGGGTEVTAEIGPTKFYGRYVEHGTSKMGPRPFLGPAADQRTDAIAKNILDAAAETVLG